MTGDHAKNMLKAKKTQTPHAAIELESTNQTGFIREVSPILIVVVHEKYTQEAA